MPAILAIFSKKKLDPPLFSILQMLEWNKRASFYAIVLILLWKKLHFKLAITLQPIFIRFFVQNLALVHGNGNKQCPKNKIEKQNTSTIALFIATIKVFIYLTLLTSPCLHLIILIQLFEGSLFLRKFLLDQSISVPSDSICMFPAYRIHFHIHSHHHHHYRIHMSNPFHYIQKK